MTTKAKYQCKFCNKSYKRKGCYKTHILICEEIHNTKYLDDKKDNSINDLPTKQEMYYLLQTFIKRTVVLEEKVICNHPWI